MAGHLHQTAGMWQEASSHNSNWICEILALISEVCEVKKYDL